MADSSHLAPDSDSDSDFTAMPALCDREVAAAKAVEAAPVEAASVVEAAPVVDADGWEDVLGSGRLRRRVVTEGEEGGRRPGRGDRAIVTVEERLVDSGRLVGEEKEVEFNVGEAEVVQCLDLVLPLMARGEVAEVRTDHSFAYGVSGDGERVPGGADLCLTVRLVDWRSLGPAPDIPLVERAAIGNLKRERGNAWYSRGEFSLSVQCYRKAAEFLDDIRIEEDMEVPIDRFLLPKDLQVLLEDRVKTFNNMAQAQMKLEAWDSSLASVRQVLRIQPNNEKALFRKAVILQEKGRLEEATGILRRINRLYPANKQCHAQLARLTGQLKAGRTAEQHLSRKMLGLDSRPPGPGATGLLSRPVQIGLAALGGLGAVAGALLLRHYIQP